MFSLFGLMWRNLKWVALATVFVPFLTAFLGYDQATTANELLKDGVEAMADVDGGKRRTGRRSGTSFSLNLSWKDAAGKSRQFQGVSIPRDIADRIIVDDMLTIDKVKIRYLPNAPDRAPVLAETVGTGGDPSAGALNGFIMTLPTAAIGAGLFWFLRRRERKGAAATPPTAP